MGRTEAVIVRCFLPRGLLSSDSPWVDVVSMAFKVVIAVKVEIGQVASFPVLPINNLHSERL